MAIQTIYTNSDCKTSTGYTVPSPEHQKALTIITKDYFLLMIHLWYFFFPDQILFKLHLSTKHDHFYQRQRPHPLSCIPLRPVEASSPVVIQELLDYATQSDNNSWRSLCYANFLGFDSWKMQ